MSNRLNALQAQERLASPDRFEEARPPVLFSASVNGHAQAVIFAQGQAIGTQRQRPPSPGPSRRD